MNSDDHSRDAFASQFGQDTDPLAKFEDDFRALEQQGSDPFELFMQEDLLTDDPREGTIEGYETTIQQWKEYMTTQDRHPACPNERHARNVVPWLLEGKHARGGKGSPNSEATVETKLRYLSRVYEFWQDEPSLPAAFNEFNPFELALSKSNLARELPPNPPNLSLDDVRDAIRSIPHIRDRSMAILQFKLGLRAGAVTNIKVEDIDLGSSDLRAHYDDLGTHPQLEGMENAIHIPPRDDPELPWPGRDGNKSRRPRVMPLDDELRRTIRQVLLIRPMNPDGYLFLSKRSHGQIDPEYVNVAVKEGFEDINEDEKYERYRKITSHYGRHFFSSYWRNDLDTNSEYVKYMRGDATSEDVDAYDALAHYVHTYHEDIRDEYLNDIYKLHV